MTTNDNIVEEYEDENGDPHRIDGPAVTYSDGQQYWWYHGKLHREDGPAVIYRDGSQFWFYHDKRHRIDGPAVIQTNEKHEWYYHGKSITDQVEHWCNERNLDIDDLSEEDKLALSFAMKGFIDE